MHYGTTHIHALPEPNSGSMPESGDGGCRDSVLSAYPVTCFIRPHDAIRFGRVDSGELEALGPAYWDGSDGVVCSKDW